MRVAFLTLGCKVNSYETEKMKKKFEKRGHRIVAFEEKADVYIVNTCTVTNIADRKSRKMLHRAKRMNEDSVVVATGCYVDSAGKRGETDESVDLFIPNGEKEQIVSLVEKAVSELRQVSPEEMQGQEKGKSRAALAAEHTRAYVKVQNGCNQYCTYCIIPYVRGPLQSKPVEEVVEEVSKLAESGIQEVVLTGIHLSSYGVDFTDKKNFLELEGKYLLELVRSVAEIEGVKRIRLGSLEPRVITEKFVADLARMEKVCPHFHLSLQSGCDDTLKRMNRHYTAQDYLEKVAILRKYYQHPAITTDIIVGFPGETEEEFKSTCGFAGKVGFAQIHVFKYSRRKGTMADAMEGQIAEPVKGERSDVLLEIEKELERAYQAHFLGKTTRVLLEEIVFLENEEYFVGYNERYVRVAVKRKEAMRPEDYCNSMVSVQILGQMQEGILFGELEEK